MTDWEERTVGLIKDAKAEMMHSLALRALQQGRWIFTPVLNTPAGKAGLSGSIDDWGMMVEAIEAAGWMLSHWSIGQDEKGRPQAYPLFRRVPQQQQADVGHLGRR